MLDNEEMGALGAVTTETTKKAARPSAKKASKKASKKAARPSAKKAGKTVRPSAKKAGKPQKTADNRGTGIVVTFRVSPSTVRAMDAAVVKFNVPRVEILRRSINLFRKAEGIKCEEASALIRGRPTINR